MLVGWVTEQGATGYGASTIGGDWTSDGNRSLTAALSALARHLDG